MTSKNIENISVFMVNYDNRYLIIQKNKTNRIYVELEWKQSMLETCNILLIKKNNFHFYENINLFSFSQMIHVVNLDFRNESDLLNMSFQYINKMMLPLLGIYRNQFEKKSNIDKNTFITILRKVNELNFSFTQCQEMVVVSEIKIEYNKKIKEIVVKKEMERFLTNPDLLTQEQII